MNIGKIILSGVKTAALAERHAASFAATIAKTALSGPTPSPSPGPAPTPPSGQTDRRSPDERGGRRLRNDEVFRRPEGGTGRGGHLDNDWAGRAILERYLRGGGDWTITDNPAWTNYMEANQSLREQLLNPTQDVAQQALSNYLTGDNQTGTFNETMHAEIENGESIVGYQYLHGTNRSEGDFQYQGSTSVRQLDDGTYEVTIHGGYTWNDTIDPNPKYSTDQWKSAIAEAITFGNAEEYDIHITWHEDTTVILDASGTVLSISGYPAP